MVIMDAYYSSNCLIELWRNIDQLHLSYLEMEESPEKIEHRNKLEDCIREYLCIAAHSQKFVFRETGDVLYRSACNKRDFSGYKASTGWNSIQLYAGNLLSQPWRKEYRQIKTYCGFYKHQIEANLVGAEVMFETMGYKHSNGGVLILDGPICPDRVTNVSKDCLIAYVECQIIKAIWEELSQTFNITWLEVLEFRKNHLCSPEQSIRALTYEYRHKQYQEHNYNQVPGGLSQQLPTIPPPPPPPPPLPPTQYIYGSNGCCGYGNYSNYTTLPPPPPPPLPQQSHYSYPLPLTYPSTIKSPISAPTNGYYCDGNNGFIPQPVYDYHHLHHHHRVPTGQLIELDLHDGGLNNSNNNNNQKNRNSPKLEKFKSSINEKDCSGVGNGGEFEDWDYVYRNLESQGYTKDLGERGDILYSTIDDKQRKKTTKKTNLNDNFNNLSIIERPLRINEVLERYEQEPVRNSTNIQHERKPSQSSLYDNMIDRKITTNTTKSIKLKNPSGKDKNTNINNNNNKNNSEISKKDDLNKWECKTCTFLNDNSHDICEMCSKSRTNIEQKMEIGGAECSKCTLVNPKEKNACEACGASLKNSPTYI